MSKRVRVKQYSFTLSDDDYNILLERFDQRNVVTSDAGRVTIEKPCICHKYSDCVGCPLRKYDQVGHRDPPLAIFGCTGLLIAAGINTRHLALARHNISWRYSWDREARDELRVLHTMLLNAKDI